MEMELLSNSMAEGHLIRAGEGGADRPDLMCVESDRSVECERV